MDKRNHKALVVLSGGQDSVTCLGWALACYKEVIAISFAYNQKHLVELQCATKVCEKYKVNHRIVNLGQLVTNLVTSALTGPGEVGVPHPYKPGLPSSFVPGRNALFLVLAHAYAQEQRADVIVAGVCETDYSGYPDCRENFVSQLGGALNTGYQAHIQIVTPLMHLNKAQTFELTDEIGFLDEVLENSHTCYNGDHEHRHEWGYGCGTCPACELREKGFQEFKENKEARWAEKHNDSKPAPAVESEAAPESPQS